MIGPTPISIGITSKVLEIAAQFTRPGHHKVSVDALDDAGHGTENNVNRALT
jgi:hypothetical protein